MPNQDRCRQEVECLLILCRIDPGSLLPLKGRMARIVFHRILLQSDRDRWLALWST